MGISATEMMLPSFCVKETTGVLGQLMTQKQRLKLECDTQKQPNILYIQFLAKQVYTTLIESTSAK